MAKKINESFFKWLFLVAAIYDIVLGVLFLFWYKQIYNYFNIEMLNFPAYLQMSAAFVFAMGVGYYFVYKNMYRNVDLVKLGVVYKAAYSGVVGYFYFTNIANIMFFWFALIDFGFLLLFVLFLVEVRKDGRYKKWV